MNINSSSAAIKQTKEAKTQAKQSTNNQETTVQFSDELKGLKDSTKVQEKDTVSKETTVVVEDDTPVITKTEEIPEKKFETEKLPINPINNLMPEIKLSQQEAVKVPQESVIIPALDEQVIENPVDDVLKPGIQEIKNFSEPIELIISQENTTFQTKQEILKPQETVEIVEPQITEETSKNLENSKPSQVLEENSKNILPVIKTPEVMETKQNTQIQESDKTLEQTVIQENLPIIEEPKTSSFNKSTDNIEPIQSETALETKERQELSQAEKDVETSFDLNKSLDNIEPIQSETALETKERQELPQAEKDVETSFDLNKSLEELTTIVKEINQSEEKPLNELKKPEKFDDKIVKKEQTNKTPNKTEIEQGDDLINNDFKLKTEKDILPQMTPNMNFSGDGQPFSSFMGNEQNDENKEKSNNILGLNSQELKEENEILSTMDENIAIANKNMLTKENIELKPNKIEEIKPQVVVKPIEEKTIVKKPEPIINTILEVNEEEPVEQVAEKVVNREDGIKKVDTKTGITIENIVKYDSIIMNETDVEVFTNLVENKEVNLNQLTSEAAQKTTQVSKTLADMLAKSMDNNQPLRIDFDNGISVIIKVSRDGKISADFLPSTQIAETYLKENLPILRQRFNDNNLDYEELNQRGRREQNRDENRKKGRKDE